MKNNKSFIELIKQYKIHIPEIQRDYAQGRNDKKTKDIRDNFLDEIFSNLSSEENKPLILDFVYGSTSNETNSFVPLDGQQRLTTLFLLHWYLLTDKHCSILKDNNESRFTYATRTSSNDFCNKLVNNSLQEIKDNFESSIIENKNSDENKKSLSVAIQNEPWFMWSWRKDPTVQGMLTMLDTIDELVENRNLNKDTLWKRLKEGKVVFKLLLLEEFGLTDELYIKMNARGKELSDFDILKSTLEEQMMIHVKNNEDFQTKWRRNFDTLWMDLFWNKKAAPKLKELAKRMDNENMKEEGLKIVQTVEKDYLIFLNRLMSFHLFMIDDFPKKTELNTNQSIDIIRKETIEAGTLSNLNLLCKCAFFETSLFSFITETMDNIIYEEQKEINDFQTIKMWNIDNNPVDNIFDVFIKDKITYSGWILFFAEIQFAKFYRAQKIEHSNELRTEFANWMRVIRNLVYNSSINNIADFRNILKELESLAESNYKNLSIGILHYLADNNAISCFNKEQIEEEREKARQIIKGGKTWKDKIEKAEKDAFFKGSIRFLFTDAEGNYDWSTFDEKWNNTKKYFDVNGVCSEYRTNAKLLTAFISRVIQWNSIIGKIFDNEASSWRSILTDKSLQFPTHHILLGNLNVVESTIDNNRDTHKKLCNSSLIDYIATNMKNSRINDIHNYVAIYPIKSSWGIFLNANFRDKLLTKALKSNKIKLLEQSMKVAIDIDPFLFLGWDIYFEYNNKMFRWNRDNYIREINKHGHALPEDENYIYSCKIEEECSDLISVLNKLPISKKMN